MKNLSEKAAQNLDAVRKNKPLIHNITNFVVMNYTANALLAMGASPVMAHAPNDYLIRWSLNDIGTCAK